MGFFNPGGFAIGFFKPPSEGSPDPGDQYVGSLYNETGWADLTDFTALNSFAPSISSGELVFTGDHNDFTTGLKFGPINNDENLEIEVRFRVSTEGNGISVGRARGQYTWGLDFAIQWDTDSDQINFWWVDNSMHLIDSSLTAPSVSAGDECLLRFTQAGNVITAYALNEDTLADETYTKTCNMGATKNFRIPNTAQAAVWQHGGTSNVLQLRLESNTISNPDILCIGDSKTTGFAVEGELYLRWADQLKGCGSVSVMAGDGDQTAGIKTCLPYILANIDPCTVVLSIGSNDVREPVAEATWQANLDDIVGDLKTAGFTVVHLLPIPESVLDQSVLKEYIEDTYTTDDQVDPSIGWVADKHISADGVHPGATGNYHISAALIASGYLPAWSPRSAYLLETYIGCRLALSFRKLSSLYTGNCIKVRRSSDNATQDIGFSGDTLDTSTLLTFVGANNGFIDTWYDQSGNNEHAIPASSAAQPQIVSSGSLITNSSDVVARFDGSDDKATITATLSGEVSAYFVAACHRSDISNAIDLLFTTKGAGLSDPGFAVELSNKFVSTTQRQYIFDAGTNGTTATIYKNGATTPITLTLDELFVGNLHTSNSATTTGIVLGNFPGDDWPGQNDSAELLVWPYLSSSDMRNAVEAGQGTAYGITVA